MRVALGFRAHSGWAALVAAAGSVEAPRIVLRRRIVIADPEAPGSKQPFHAAAEMPFAGGEAHIRKMAGLSRGLAAEAIEAAVKALRHERHDVTAAVVLRGAGRPLPDLASILASHALIHTAEGEMFRDVLVFAAQSCGLRVGEVREKDLDANILRALQPLGKQIGPPWTVDQKLAAAAALSEPAGLSRAAAPSRT